MTPRPFPRCSDLTPRPQVPAAAVERGSVSTEVTLATPFLVLLLVLVAVFIHRGVDARLRVDDAAHQAARAASLARTSTGAVTAAQHAADASLAQAGVDCEHPDVGVDTSDFQPGGVVTVTVTCHVDLTQAALLNADAGRDVSATASSPIDVWRATALPSTTIDDARTAGVFS